MNYLKTKFFSLLQVFTATVIICCLLQFNTGCKGKAGKESGEDEDAHVATTTPVTVDTMSTGPIEDYLELNATSSFLKKNSVKSPTSGYIQQVEVNIGDEVTRNKELFLLKTKEASALDNNTRGHDTTFSFSGLIKVHSFQEGVISTLNRHNGDYVQEGDELCVVSDKSSFVFLLDVPYELHQFIREGGVCEIVLPDKQVLPGTITSRLPSMDVTSQTESYLIKTSSSRPLPENLIARIRIVKDKREKAQTLPNTALLSNETQTEFWVMKLLNDSVAIKVPVKKGLETAERTEIVSPAFEPHDRVIISGNYGLSDTAHIIINRKEKE